MHLKLSLTFYFTCLLNILLESVSSQLILPKEYFSLDMSRNDERNHHQQQQQPYSLPDQRPGSIHQQETILPSQRKEYVKQVEGHLLQMFGLKSRPKPGKGTNQVHPYLVHLYSDIQSSNSVGATSNTIKRRRSMDARITIKGSHNTIRSHDLKGKTSLHYLSNFSLCEIISWFVRFFSVEFFSDS